MTNLPDLVARRVEARFPDLDAKTAVYCNRHERAFRLVSIGLIFLIVLLIRFPLVSLTLTLLYVAALSFGSSLILASDGKNLFTFNASNWKVKPRKLVSKEPIPANIRLEEGLLFDHFSIGDQTWTFHRRMRKGLSQLVELSHPTQQ